MKVILCVAIALLLAGSASALPPLQPSLTLTNTWTCTGPQNRDFVHIVLPDTFSNDGVNFRQDCSGRIGNLTVSGRFSDCLKVNPPAPAPHDMVIESGYCRADLPPPPGAHQDCIQAGGGHDFLIQNFVFDCIGGGGGNYFIATFNGGDPDTFVCDHCAFGPRHPNQIRVMSDNAPPNDSTISGARNSLVCKSNSGNQSYNLASANMGGNISPAASDPQCTFEGMVAWANGAANPPPPPPPSPPPPSPPPAPPPAPLGAVAQEDVAGTLLARI